MDEDGRKIVIWDRVGDMMLWKCGCKIVLRRILAAACSVADSTSPLCFARSK